VRYYQNKYHKGIRHDNDRPDEAVGCAREINDAQTRAVETIFAKIVFEFQLSQGHVSIVQYKKNAHQIDGRLRLGDASST
jgi:hypothetical protein